MARFVVLCAILAGVVAATAAAVRHRGAAPGHDVPGGILMGQPGLYDKLTGILMGSLIRGIAADVAAGIPAGAGRGRARWPFLEPLPLPGAVTTPAGA